MEENAASLSRGYMKWGKKLTQAHGALFFARTPLGRSTKMVLFGIGAVLPLGTVIWVLLLSHGLRVKRASSVKSVN
ncbi:hypothetical protein [Propionivibrio sp.]|jgi:hypothetical protein|uniref:hypothetical protein n=1 Tax=Propionivibrio sp. TaxID=2212460 RepID=UPI0039E3F2FE